LINRLVVVLMIITCYSIHTDRVAGAVAPIPEMEHQIVDYLNKLFNTRAQFLLSKDDKVLNPYYLSSENTSRYALKQEEIRKQYIHAWATQRKLRFIDAESHIRIQRIQIEGERAKVSIVQSLRLVYANREPFSFHQSFGVGTRHALSLIQKNGQWYVLKEWYSDPLNENPKLISKTNEHFPNPQIHQYLESSINNNQKTNYERDRAVAYANKYSGAAWGAGNNSRYNKKYLDYTSKGGDCTNFASQVIGDPTEGGGLQMTANWRYWYSFGGSHPWVQTDRFSKFLLSSGYGQLVAKGTFEEVTQPSEKYPYGAIGQLKPGDLIAYILHGEDVDHFGILVGFDDYGYPLVNSHTADRFRVPFDLGWDQHTRYQLIHIRD
jgi:hypothetical protein